MVIGIVAGIVSFLAYPLYIVSILRKETVPHAITWMLSAILAGISLFLYKTAGGHDTIYVLLGDFVGLTIIAILAWRYGRNGYFSFANWICIGGVFVSITVFLILGNPFVAFLFSLIAEVLALVPTAIKTYKFPKQEGFLAWTFTCAGDCLNLLAMDWGNYTELSYVWTIFVANGIVWILILRGRGK